MRQRPIPDAERDYLPVRRLAVSIEKGVEDNTKWAVFEPNNSYTWGKVASSVDGFMQGLFEQGALAGSCPEEAYFVKCGMALDAQGDVDGGTVNIVVGFAPLKPAEFVIISIQQLAGQRQKRGRKPGSSRLLR